MRGDCVLFVERANELAVYGKAKAVSAGAVAKASANSASDSYIMTVTLNLVFNKEF